MFVRLNCANTKRHPCNDLFAPTSCLNMYLYAHYSVEP